jgi:hypothetical protein
MTLWRAEHRAVGEPRTVLGIPPLKDRRATFPMTKRRQKPKKALKNLLAVESAKPRRVASCYGPDQIRDLESTRKDRYSRTFSRI